MQIKDELRKAAQNVEGEQADDHFVEIFLDLVELVNFFLAASARVDREVFFSSDVLTNDANKHDIDDQI